MNTRVPARYLVFEFIQRSNCRVRMAAVLTDRNGINFCWGWNYAEYRDGATRGVCAEKHAIRRANKKRLRGATITIAGIYRGNGNLIPAAKPCADCERILRKYGIAIAEFITKSGKWQKLAL